MTVACAYTASNVSHIDIYLDVTFGQLQNVAMKIAEMCVNTLARSLSGNDDFMDGDGVGFVVG